ncbi:MAG TPA: SGNH/GDSL hydrolase family protein [Burkholderiaceae bacterium]
MKIVTFGDSIVWGQGLYPQQKFTWQVYRALAGKDPTPATLIACAHSGATIGAGSTIVKPALDGEVPDSYPTILQQCANYQGTTDDVDYVIVDGGINDVNSFILDNPLLDRDDLQERIVKHCYSDMLALLGAIAARFGNPRTRIVLLGYYQILSEFSDRELTQHVCGLHGIRLVDFLEKLGDVVLDKIFSQHAFFAEQSAVNLRRAADEVNQGLGAKRIVFVLPPFGPQNSMFAADSWIFGIDRNLQAEDPFVAERQALCNRDETDLVRRRVCYVASVGHPNVIGAQKIAGAVLAALG